MNENRLNILIDNTLLALDKFVSKSQIYSIEKEPISDMKKVLNLLKLEVHKNPNKINERVLRATRDVGGILSKQFEETDLIDPFYEVIDFLNIEIKSYKDLEPLRLDFGKENPI